MVECVEKQSKVGGVETGMEEVTLLGSVRILAIVREWERGQNNWELEPDHFPPNPDPILGTSVSSFVQMNIKYVEQVHV